MLHIVIHYKMQCCTCQGCFNLKRKPVIPATVEFTRTEHFQSRLFWLFGINCSQSSIQQQWTLGPLRLWRLTDTTFLLKFHEKHADLSTSSQKHTCNHTEEPSQNKTDQNLTNPTLNNWKVEIWVDETNKAFLKTLSIEQSMHFQWNLNSPTLIWRWLKVFARKWIQSYKVSGSELLFPRKGMRQLGRSNGKNGLNEEEMER